MDRCDDAVGLRYMHVKHANVRVTFLFVQKLTPLLTKKSTQLATTCEFRTISNLFGIGISTACMAFHDVCYAIRAILTPFLPLFQYDYEPPATSARAQSRGIGRRRRGNGRQRVSCYVSFHEMLYIILDKLFIDDVFMIVYTVLLPLFQYVTSARV